MWHGFALCLSLLGADEVTVKPLHGDTVRGSLVSLSEKGLVVIAANEDVKFDAAAVQSLRPIRANTTPIDNKQASSAYVELSDDSVLVGTHVRLKNGVASLEALNRAEITIPNKVIRSLRFRKQDEELQKQWGAIAAAESAGDQLVVRKVAGEGAPNPGSVVLDQLEGVIHGVTASEVAFEFDGEQINVSLEKVEGIIFHQRLMTQPPDPICRVRDESGSEWNVQSMQFTDGRLSLQTVTGVRGDIHWDQVLEVDFTAGNLVYLSDMKVESMEWRPFLVTPVTPPTLSKWFGVRRDQTLHGSVLTLGGQSYEKGLALHSRSTISFRLTKDYQHFQAVAGIDERFRSTANLKLTITGDERILLERNLRGSDPPAELDLDIRGVRRLKILVDFGEDRSDAGDHLLLCNARVTK